MYYTPVRSYRYFEKIDAMSEPDYTPSEEDVLLCRSRTIGIVKTVLEIDKNEFNIFDVGGQRNERRKWIHCFDEVTAVIFVAALSEYDQVTTPPPPPSPMRHFAPLFFLFVSANHPQHSAHRTVLRLYSRIRIKTVW